jgi:hypothetical protein
MLSFKQYFLKESPDAVNGQVYKSIHAITIGIIKGLSFWQKIGRHVDMYNDLYLTTRQNSLNKNNLKKLRVTIIGDYEANKEILFSRIRNCPWSVVNSKQIEIEPEILRDDFFDVSGRLWIDSKTISFWNTQSTVQSYSKQLHELFKSLGQNIQQYKFEFIEHQKILFSYWDFMGIPYEAHPHVDQKLLRMQHTSPEIKKGLHGSADQKLRAAKTGKELPAQFHNRIRIGD